MPQQAGMDMHMIESSLESLRLQQAYLMQQQGMIGPSMGGGGVGVGVGTSATVVSTSSSSKPTNNSNDYNYYNDGGSSGISGGGDVTSNLDDLDEYSQKASRTLYIWNLDRDVKAADIRDKLDKRLNAEIIGEIEIIRKENNNNNNTNNGSSTKKSSILTSAYVQFSDIKSVIRAQRSLHGKLIGKNEIRVGFGRTKATRMLWLDNVSEQVRESQLADYLRPFCESDIEQIVIDRNRFQALIYFAYASDARECVDKLRERKFHEKRVSVDFASKELIATRFNNLMNNNNHHHHHYSNHHSSHYRSSSGVSSTNPSNNNNNLSIPTSYELVKSSRGSPTNNNGTTRSSRSSSVESDSTGTRRKYLNSTVALKSSSSHHRTTANSSDSQSSLRPASSSGSKLTTSSSNNKSASSSSTYKSNREVFKKKNTRGLTFFENQKKP